MKQRGLSSGTPLAEGATFVTIETRANASKRDAKVLCKIISCVAASDATGPYKLNEERPVLVELLNKAMLDSQTKAEDVGIIMTSHSGVASVDAAEKMAIAAFWSSTEMPVIASTSTRWGNLLEAGGLGEVAFISHCYDTKKIPDSAVVRPGGVFNEHKRRALILRSSPWGEYSCMIIEME